ncbi:UspA domain-containing protein [Oleidesulfovibrio alaskensis G20]|jgi:nucleotide-binding universal stress UspA family protein|uniref:UspA domain-containing protein n=1 Tax=Oleidesulfovibrio alaskensis (strain ATCC BAA-1058 / DSM 17464 / G20) TaxID=207559 RepID=Q30UZ1_OLEA2|nr:universal stress protein [Oleidesulfovibrio alaskensis]ABB40505.1 UspA domain-containing protein [Oleidesulfovibrio alaskensis G20]MBG0772757.1 universal stress protein [Oleidesulfovibrio alaskensis]MBL3583213.1 universal stress protein [Oleidesulfovibrio alaskensis]
MFKKILFATSASPACDNAAKVAFDLARRNGAKLYVFHVMGVPSRGFSHMVRDLRSGEEEHADGDYRDWVVEELQSTYAEQMEGFEKNTSIELAVGVPHTEVLRFARQNDVDLIVMGANTREDDPGAARTRSIIGNTMQRVARVARCPVLIVNRPCTTCWNLFSNIVFCTDFSKAADSAFKFALSAAREVNARLYLFHAFDINASRLGVFPGQAELERTLEKAHAQMQERYLSHMGDFDNYQVDIWEGTPYVEILKYARERKADLVVMAHHTKEVNPDQAEIGSTVEQVVLRSACPVASVVHPDKVAA